jgi:hypothetical protein
VAFDDASRVYNLTSMPQFHLLTEPHGIIEIRIRRQFGINLIHKGTSRNHYTT